MTRQWWRVALAFAAYTVWGLVALVPLGLAVLFRVALVALALAVLVWSAPRRRPPEMLLAAAAAGVALWWLLLPGGPVAQLLRTWTILFVAAFGAAAWWRPGRFLPRAAFAIGIALLGTALLVMLAGPSWEALRWYLERDSAIAWRRAAAMFPVQSTDLVALGDRLVTFQAEAFPALLALQSLAAGAIAWAIAHRVAHQAPGEPLGRFRDFRFSDHAVWGILLGVAGLLLPIAWLKTVALNTTVAAAALYLVRGLAITAALLEAGGVSPLVVVAVAAASLLLTVPLLVLVPGVWLLGLSDTWFDFRRRLAGARSAS